MKSIFQLDRYREVRDAADAAIPEMNHHANDLKEVLAEHGVRVVKVAADADGRYVCMTVMTRACDKMDVVADKLEIAIKTLRKALFEESPPCEVQQDYISWSLDDSGWVYSIYVVVCVLICVSVSVVVCVSICVDD
jgi:hypothetical protein